MLNTLIRAVIGGIIAAFIASIIAGIFMKLAITQPYERDSRPVDDNQDFTASEQEVLLRELASQLDPLS